MDVIHEELHERRQTDREIAKMIAEIDYLKKAVEAAQKDITTSLLERKEFTYMIKALSTAVEDLKIVIDKWQADITKDIHAVDDKINDHLKNDKPIDQIVTAKIGKWVIAGIITLGSIIGLAILKDFAEPIINIFTAQRSAIINNAEYIGESKVKETEMEKQIRENAERSKRNEEMLKRWQDEKGLDMHGK